MKAMKDFNISDNTEAIKGNDTFGIVPYKVLDHDKEFVYIFTFNVDETEVKTWADLVKLNAFKRDVSPASAWPAVFRNKIIDAF